MTWTKQATFEDNNLTHATTGFNTTSGNAGLSLTTPGTRTLVLTPADTYIESGTPSVNYGGATVLAVGEHNASTDVFRTLLKYDLSSIPSNASISSVVLAITVYADYSSNARTFRVYRMNKNWSEMGSNWYKYNGTDKWTTDGGFVTADCEQTDIGTCDFSSSETPTTVKSFTLTAAKIVELIDGTKTNLGFMVKADTENNDLYLFTTKPTLTIQYTVTGNSKEMTAAISTSLDSYGSFTALGGVRRAESEMWFDPNSATIPSNLAIMRILNSNGTYPISEVVVCKPSGLTTYQYAIRSTVLLNSQSETYSQTVSPFVSAQTDDAHKIRLITTLIPLSNYYNRPGLNVFVTRSSLYIDDILVVGSSQGSFLQGVFPSSHGGITQINYGEMGSPAGSSGNLLFDNCAWAQDTSERIVPIALTGRNGNFLVRARTKKMDEVFTNPKEITLIEGSTPKISLELSDVAVVTSPSAKVYQGGTDVTSVNMPTGSCTVAGNIITTPALAALEPNTYEVCITYTIDGAVMVKQTQIKVRGAGDEL